MTKNILGKVVISGTLQCLTGMHIGASKENIEIGAIDSPVVRDPITREPYIPGSSLKGKLRALLEKALASRCKSIADKRNIGTDRNKIEIHVCNDAVDAKTCPLCRIFGSTGYNGGKHFPARLIVRDLKLTEDSREKLSDIDTGLQYTEWKFENAIDRVTSAANPLQIERVPRGEEFDFELIYNVEDSAYISDDLKNIKLALELLKLDALGGHGSRGYGKVDINYSCVRAMTVDYLSDGNPDGIVEGKSLDDENIHLFFDNGRQEGRI
jgi:CRISPR-associated protein Csm3